MKLFKYDDYKQKTEEIFKILYSEVREVLPNARIEHIGSSSIPNSISKGDLDIFVGVASNEHEKAISAIKAIGFTEKKGTFRSHELCMLVTDKFNYDVAIQVVANDSEFEGFLRFRDILKQDESLVEEYNQLKLKYQKLTKDNYRGKKSEFILSVLDKPFIRKVKSGEEAAIHNAHMRSIREVCVKDHGAHEIKGWGFRPLGERWTEAIKNDFIRVVEFKREIHGIAHFKVINKDADRFGYIHAFYFTSEVIGQGLAKKIMHEIFSVAQKEKISIIKLDSSITAYEFYKRFGFEDYGVKKSVDIGGYPVTCFPMICYLR